MRSAVVGLTIGAMAAGAAAGPVAAGFDPPPIDPGLPVVEVPLCERDWAPDFCFADYAAYASSFGAWDSWRNGGPATAFYVTIRNEGLVNPGEVWSTVSIDQYDIIEIETVWGNWDVDAAPVAEADDGSVWTIRHRDGLDADEFTTFRVWVGSWDAVDLGVTANLHAGVEYFDAPTPTAYRQPERLTTNNSATTFG